jgi:hypothetical protein
MDSEDEEETDEDGPDEPVEIIQVDEEYEVKNGLLGLKRDIILRLTGPMKREDDLKNLFGMYHEISIIKDSQFFKMLRYFPPILELKHGSCRVMMMSMK